MVVHLCLPTKGVAPLGRIAARLVRLPPAQVFVYVGKTSHAGLEEVVVGAGHIYVPTELKWEEVAVPDLALFFYDGKQGSTKQIFDEMVESGLPEAIEVHVLPPSGRARTVR